MPTPPSTHQETTNAMATESSTCFQQALNSFKAKSGPGLVAEFEMTSLEALKRSIAKIEKRQATERRMQNMRRLSKFVDIMERHGKVVEILLNTTNILALVWVFISPDNSIHRF